MPLDQEILKQLMPLFQTEAQDYLQSLNRLLLDLEKQPDADAARPLLAEIFRVAHTLKGSARTVRLDNISALAHALETLFGRIQRGQVPMSTVIFDKAYHVLDLIGSLVAPSAQVNLTPEQVAAECANLETFGNVDAPPLISIAAIQESASPASGGFAVADSPTLIVPAPLESPGEPARVSNPQVPLRDAPADEIVRVAVSKLDALFADVGELQVARIGSDQRLVETRALLDQIETWEAKWSQASPTYRQLLLQLEANPTSHASPEPPPLDLGDLRALFDFLATNEDQLRDARAHAQTLGRQLEADSRRMAQVAAELQDDVRRMRMMPAATIFDTFPRMVRDLARDLGKQVRLVIHGGATEIDRATLEQIKPPLLHLLRNAVDHGIETPEERAARGKPHEGTIDLSAAQQGGIIIQVADDGKGIDPNQVKASALQKGLLTSEAAQTMNDREALWLIFRSGFSTRAAVTDVSGRGVGMDVVREAVEQMRGVIDLKSDVGKGTRITLSLPLTVAATLCLIAQVGDETFAIPLINVEHIVRLEENAIGYAQGRAVIQYENRPIVLVSLADILQTTSSNGENKTNTKRRAIILGSAEKRAAFLVDALVGALEVVVKNFPRPFNRVRYAAGASTLGTGQVVVVLNAADLLRFASREATPTRAESSARAPEAKLVTILVADDSITTRTLEKNILQAAGYNVVLAADGMTALTLLQNDGVAPEGNINLLVSDVNMPRLDGFELTRKIRADTRLKALPVILVTSLSSREDREKGIQVGADAYIVKSDFEQDDLLATIKQLI